VVFAVASLMATSLRAEENDLVAPVADKVILTTARPAGDWTVALYGGVWTNSTLPSFPINLVRGKLTFDDVKIASLIVGRRLMGFDLDLPGTRYRLEGFTLEAEGTLSQHFGLEDHVEATAALALRSGEIGLGSMASLNLAWANGFSYAFDAPKWEYGPTHIHGVDSRRIQYYMGFEAVVTPTAAQNLSAFFRLHHRSGIYGVISPRKTGSNYVGGGLRWTFR
jgi:hypothetical protein